MHPFPHRSAGAFTLIELMVSMAVLTLMIVLLVGITDSTCRTWTSAMARSEQFRESRDAFESITRRLSQATLNTYWDYSYPNNDQTAQPTDYIRQSELRFISGSSTALGLGGNRSTHGVFFQAPLGYVSNSSYGNFRQLLNTWGFFVEFGTDQGTRPAFITNTLLPYKNRYRLFELMEPSDSLTLYQEQVKNGGAVTYTGKDWFLKPLASASNLGVVAENIIALVILPKLSPSDQTAANYKDSSLSPNYLYDSTGLAMTTRGDPNLNPKNQLPPVVQVTMVAIDETSARRIDNGTAAPDFGLASLFQSADKYQSDLDQLQANLNQSDYSNNGTSYSPKVTLPVRVNYRIFTTNVNIRAAKWSNQQIN